MICSVRVTRFVQCLCYVANMKRRQALQSILGLPALTALPRHSAAFAPPPETARSADEMPKLATVVPDAAVDGAPHYFSAPQMAALKRLGDLLAPPIETRPGAAQAGAAEFLDFLLSQSPPDRQTLYRDGLDRLQADAQQRHRKAFEHLSAEQADTILAPLLQPWTYAGPGDPFARFLRAAKDDFLQATVNSREFASAQTSRGRRGGGLGTYWYPVE